MTRLLVILALCLLPVITPLAAVAVQPDEVLSDPVMERRARDISTGLRCLVCRNENIDESNADLARDLRLLVRERLQAGDSDTQVVDFIVARYGEYVLLTPTMAGANKILWIAGPLMLIAGLAIAVGYLRKRERAEVESELSAAEKAEVDALLRE
ncbi:Cytochrome c-type biogenesis protein CcmH precursor [Aquimixticola soesokkakensis]|uniref:Cytochrome c-type biogenesis protein n=1 Tax=Aquimixticola soesokkakensis TaxID=1519096 RepID=A0A1Y5TMP4_9RHOB|nr:cytochrome c-type biogenesis protein [Aquimixticola soesokkakensis]SLN65807.1 Cytochrome c-type biogenesis protein CcmH precursor [Aquimixticola soesokkakensis]